MADEASDSKIVDRLKNQPPFEEDTEPEKPLGVEEEEETQEETPETPEKPEEVEIPAEEPAEDEQKKRTQEQFEKLKEHNASLKEELEKEKIKKQVPTRNALDALIPQEPSPVTNAVPTPQQYPNLSPKEIKDVFAGLVDSQGYVDSGLLIETLKETDNRAKEAEQRVQLAEQENKRINRRMDDFERKEIMRKVHEMYPKINPENADSDNPALKFDEAFYDAFQGEVIRQWSTTGQEDVWLAAKKWSDILYGDMKKADKEKAEEAELAKRNINATTAKQTNQQGTGKDQDELIMGTRLGRKGSLAERLKRSGY